jgi:uncharacterized delta-60 repeat protein
MKPRHKSAPTLLQLSLGFFFLCAVGGLSSAQAQQVQVTAADPASTAQGTINLNVKVTGKGFKNGAKAKWFVTGTTDPGGVTVNSTTFVSSGELTANITVADTAVIANFDIQVLNSDGRGGKGTELFAVSAKGASGSVCPSLSPAATGNTNCYSVLAGCLDTSFGGSGFVHSDPDGPSHSSYINGSVIQSDGKIIVVGQVTNTANGTGTDFVVLRFNSDGSIDTSFGSVNPSNPSLRLGYVMTAFTTSSDWASSVGLQTDGKIVVGGFASPGGFAVARYNNDGTLDTAFASGGKTIIDFASAASVRQLVIQSDGKIVLAGEGGAPSQFGLARLNQNGTLDSTFGSGGKLIVNPSDLKRGNGFAWSVALQRIPAVIGEERIVVGGWATENPFGGSTASTFALMRFRPSGAVDTTFGNNGRAYVPFFGFNDQSRQIAIDSANRIVAAGIVHTGNDSCGAYVQDYGVARLTTNGALDTTFGGGKQTADIYGGADNVYGLALQLDGKILLSGYAHSSDLTLKDFALLRLNADGTRDSSFGLLGNGVVTTDFFGLADYAIAVAIQPGDGKIVVAGTIDGPSSKGEVAVARYWP